MSTFATKILLPAAACGIILVGGSNAVIQNPGTAIRPGNSFSSGFSSVDCDKLDSILNQLLNKDCSNGNTGNGGSGNGSTGNGNAGGSSDAQLPGGYLEQVLSLVNAERAKHGLSALTLDSTLSDAAAVRAKESAVSFSHTRPNGSDFSSIFREFGISYRRGGENLAWGQKTPEAVVQAWMNSSGHRANILNSGYQKIGIGSYTKADGTIYWAQLFTN